MSNIKGIDVSNNDGEINFSKDMSFWEANYNNDPWNLPSNFFSK